VQAMRGSTATTSANSKPQQEKMGERQQPLSRSPISMRAMRSAWRSEGFSVAWGKFTKTRFNDL
jgi:hypothetical protein